MLLRRIGIFYAIVSILALVVCSPLWAANLIVNWDFSLGNTGFSTEFTYSPGDITNQADYDIVSDPHNSHWIASSYSDYTGDGNMMAVNGSTNSSIDIVWSQDVNVTPEQDYCFSVWISSWNNPPPALLSIEINGVEIISSHSAPTANGLWENVSYIWNSQSSTIATINIRNISNDYNGNDFAIDGIIFEETVAATWHEFPDFETEGEWIDGEFVYEMDRFNDVPSYLNSKNNGSYGSGASYYQCTEYVARYLHRVFNTDYTDVKDVNNEDTQGFLGFDFHPNYSGTPPQPTSDRGNDSVSLRRVTIPQEGDIAVLTSPNHSAIVKSIGCNTITLIEQNWIWWDPQNEVYKYITDRTIDATEGNFYRFDPVGYFSDGWHIDGSSQSIYNAYMRNGGFDSLGNPCNNGEGDRVHGYTFKYHNNDSMVYLQDVCNEATGQRTICYLPGAENAYLLKGCLGSLWWVYQSVLGAPTSDEIDDPGQIPEPERSDGFDVMQTFQYGSMFWSSTTGLVRVKCDSGICNDTPDIDLCIPAGGLAEAVGPVYSTCEEMLANSGLNNGPWSMFGHDVRHTGRSTYRVAPVPILRWRHHVDGYVYSSSSIGSDGTIYVGNHDRTAYGWYEYLYAFNPDGSQKWRYEMDPHVSITSTPAIGSDGTLYVGAWYYYTSYTPHGYLYAINPDGSLLWRYDVGECRVRTSPTIDSAGMIYFGADDEYLYAINPDGSLKWRYKAEGEVKSSAAIGSSGTIYVGSFDHYLYAINPDGTLLWRYQTDGNIKSSPAIDSSGTIYVGSFDDYLYAINPDGTLLWRYQTDGDVKSSPAIDSSGTIYVGSYDHYLYAINPDGTIKWRYRTGDGIHSSPAIDSSGTIFVGSYDNYLYAINPDGTIKWRYRTDNDIHSSPSISSDGSVYIASHDYYFYAIGIPEQIGGELAVNFGDDGLWHYDSSTWTQLNGQNPEGMEEWDDGLAADFAASGLWNYNGSSWNLLTTLNPQCMKTWTNGLAVDFGGTGLWSYDGSSWDLLTTNDPQDMESWTNGLAVDFGTFGLWNYNGSSWDLLTTSNAQDLTAWSNGLAVDFGTFGLWNYNGSSWDLLTTSDAQSMEAWSGGLAVDFSTFGLWNYNGSSWNLLTTSNAEFMAAWANGLAVDFGGTGLWSYDGSSWDLLTISDAQDMEGWTTSLAVDLGASGLWNYDGSSWASLTGWDAEDIIDVDLY